MASSIAELSAYDAASILASFERVPSTPAPLPSPHAPPSFWQQTYAGPGAEQGVRDDRAVQGQADVAIVGSGITGISALYHLARTLPAPARLVVLEARDFCGGATGRNGGHLTPVSALWYSDLAASQAHLSRYLPPPPPGKTREEVWGNDRGAQTDETVRRMLTLEARTVAELLALTRGEMAMEKKRARVSKTQEHDINPQLVMQGNWTLAFTQQEEQAYEDALERAKRAGLSDWAKHVRRVDPEEVRTALGAREVRAAWSAPGSTVHPRRLVALLYHAARREAAARGIEIEVHTSCPVKRIAEQAGPHRARLATARGELEARYVVHATNGWASHLAPQLAGPDGIVPTRGQVVAVRPTQAVDCPQGLLANDGLEYALVRPLSEEAGAPPPIILGGGREKVASAEWGMTDDHTTAPEASQFLRSYLPTLAPEAFGGQAPHAEWTGIMGFTRSRDPLVGPLLRDSALGGEQAAAVPGQFISAGYSGHGMPRAFSCAEAVAQMIVAEERGQEWDCPVWFPRCYLTAPPSLLHDGAH